MLRRKPVRPRLVAPLPLEALELRRLLNGYVPLAPYTSPFMVGYFAPAGTVDLQRGAAQAPNVAAGQAAALPRNIPVNARGLPLLNSRPNGAGLEIFLDFPTYYNGVEGPDQDGFSGYSLDGDLFTFNFDEQLAVYNCWRKITGWFSQFNVNVTTAEPPRGAADPNFAWMKLSNDFPGGAAFFNSLTKFGPTGHDNGGDVIGRISGIAHEIGHIMGLAHQANFDANGGIAQEYSGGDGYRNVPLMGLDFNGVPNSRFWYGRVSFEDAGQSIFDDVFRVENRIWQEIGTPGVDQYRPDDFGNTPATAYALPAGSQQLDAYIERYNDADYFRVAPTAAGNWSFAATPLFGSGAEPKLEVLNAAGEVVAGRDDADLRAGPTNEQFLNFKLDPGTYYARVTSSSDYAELGYYQFSATQLPGNYVSSDIGVPAVGGSVTHDAAAGTFTQGAGGTDIWNTSDQFRYTYQTLTGNGSITARVDAVDNIGTYTKAGVMIRQSLAGNSQHAFMGVVPSGNVDTIWRGTAGAGSANVNNSGAGPWVRLTRAGNTITFESSANGTAWTNLGTRTINMTGPVLIGLASAAWSDRAQAFATFSNVSTIGNTSVTPPTYNALPAPATLAAAPAAGANNTSVSLNWAAVIGASGYRVERSVNGVDFAEIAQVSSGVTSYTDVNVWGSMRWFYRVSAGNGTSVFSAPSPTANAVNRPNAPTLPSYTAPVIVRSSSQLDVTFLDVQGEAGYRVDLSTDGGATYAFHANLGANVTSRNLTGLQAGTQYKIRVTPFNAAGDGRALVFDGTTKLGAVSNLRFTARTPTALSIAWDASSAATGYYVDRSIDGTNWSNVATLTGSATAAYTDANVTPGVEYYYRVLAFNGTGDGVFSATVYATPPAATLPAGWTNANVGVVNGGPGAGGAAVSTGANAWTVVSAGNDLWTNLDSFNFTYRSLTATASPNAVITARVTAVEDTGDGKAGVVIRQSLDPNSKSVAIVLNGNNGAGIDVRTRATAGANTGYQQVLGNVGAPYWLRLTRSGNQIVAAYSTNGTAWTNAATVNSFTLSGTFFLGLGSSAGSATQLNTSTFSNVSVTGVSGAPTVATAAAATPSAVTGTTTALSVLGADDGGEANLTYAWSASGPGGVTFSANNTNAAKNATATFTRAGAYTFTATITDAGGLSTTSTVSVTVAQTLSGIAPRANASLAGLPVPVLPRDQFGDAMSVSGITWSATGGTVTQAGVFTSSGAGTGVVTAVKDGATYTAAVTSIGPRAWYKADAPSGTTLVDSSGNNRNGTLTGGYSYGAGRINSGLALTGGYADLPDGIVAGLNELTVAAWVNPTANVTWARVFDFGDDTDTYLFLAARDGGGNLRFAIKNGAAEQEVHAGTLAPNAWSHVAVTLAANGGGTYTATLYLNGAAVAASAAFTLTAGALGTTTNNYIGESQYAADPTFPGTVDDFRIYGGAAPAEAIGALFAAGNAFATSAVTNVTATAASNAQVNVAWTDNSGVELGYRVERATNAGFTSGLVAFDVAANAAGFSDATVAAGTTYHYRVTTLLAGGTTAGPAVAPPVTTPGAPTVTVTGAAHRWDVSPNLVTFAFSADVGAAAFSAASLTVTRAGGETVAVTGYSYDAATRTATFALATGLADGDYAAVLAAGGVLAADAALAFFALAGDADHDRDVDFNDLAVVAANYGQTGRTFAQGNVSYDAAGAVDFADLAILAANYNNATLPAPARAVITDARRRPLAGDVLA